ncbi:MAG: helix-turn-helix domain-containing protein [Proteobacteria bacterium]|nr:helix-turn-helix domain-containing protein [Pseudomonadota bacterium]
MMGEQEVAATLGVALNTIRNWRWRGEGPRWVKLGKRCVRYRQSAVQAFIAAGAERAA